MTTQMLARARAAAAAVLNLPADADTDAVATAATTRRNATAALPDAWTAARLNRIDAAVNLLTRTRPERPNQHVPAFYAADAALPPAERTTATRAEQARGQQLALTG